MGGFDDKKIASKAGKKSRKKTKHKITQDIQKAYKMVIENNISNFEKWIKDIAEDDPVKAFEIIIKLSGYVIPKLARTEFTGEDGKPITTLDLSRFTVDELKKLIDGTNKRA